MGGDWKPTVSGKAATVSAGNLNGAKDFMDPKSLYLWGYGKDTNVGNCDAHTRADFDIFRGPQRTQRMKLRFPDVSPFPLLCSS